MCTRFLRERAKLRALLTELAVHPGVLAAFAAAADRYNISPGKRVGALRPARGADAANRSSPASADGAADTAALALFKPRWGWAAAAPDGVPLVNARAETLAERPTFREAFRRRRCLVPATGFYEWEKRGRARLPWLFRLRNDAPFAFAALWDSPPAPAGGAEAGAGGSTTADAPADRVVIVTTTPNSLLAPIHERMPVLLRDAAACRAWLDPRTPADLLAALCAPAPAEAMCATPVSPRVNRPEFDSPECIAPAVHGVAARDTEDEPQLGL